MGNDAGDSTLSVPTPDIKQPLSDFYKYVNNKWQQHVHVPNYISSYGVSEELEEIVRNQLINVITKINNNNPLAVLSNSFLKHKYQRNSVIDLQRITNMFECINSIQDVCYSIGTLNKIQSRSPLTFVIGSDSNNSSICSIYVYEPQLGLPERRFYNTDNNSHIVNKYIRLLKTVGKLLNIEGLESVVTIEATIEPFLASTGEIRNITYTYNPIDFNELTKEYKHIDWSSIMRGIGISEELYTTHKFIITNQRYVHLLDKMCTTFDLEAWRTWLRSLVILSFLEYMPSPFSDFHYELFGRALRGSTEKIPRKLLSLGVLQKYTPQDLSKLYVNEIMKKGTKEHALILVKELQKATIQRIKELTWMSDVARTSSSIKVKKMLFQVAHPGRWYSETKHTLIHAERPLLNIINLNVTDTEKMINDLKHKCGRFDDEWEDGAFVVNAYYYAEANRMTIPAGMLQPPFFDLNKSKGWNYGGIGAAIGHEITHGFDDEGRHYDAYGNYKDTWTSNDSRIYEQLSKSIIDLFDGKEYMGGKVDGKLTLSENIADLGGLAIALTALNNQLTECSDMVKKREWRDFFISYAVSWRVKDRPKKAKQALLLDVHAPCQLRVNLIVQNFQEWFYAFDIQEGEPGWIPESKRVKLW
jgi:putative endopeptidase